MKASHIFRNEKGAILVIGLFILVLLTVLGLSTTTSTTTYLQIAGNEKFFKLSFYAAEAGNAYVAGNTDLYGSGNLDPTDPMYFPDDGDPSQKYTLGSLGQSFKGSVVYDGWMQPPAKSGYEVGKFTAHKYVMTCTGYGPRDAETQTQVGFYRIGF